MKRNRFLTFVLVLPVIGLLSGCGAPSRVSEKADAANGAADYSYAYVEDGLAKSEQSTQIATPVNQKLIRKVWMEAQTQDMDALLSDVEARIAELDGYVESRDIYNGTSDYGRNRTASLTIRIPAEKLDLFVDRVGEVSNIISHTESTDDVTLSYVSTESRIKALEAEEARLLELVSVAETLEDLLTLETKLTDIRTELEEHKSQLKLYDSLVSYGTIHLSVEEVREYTVVEEEEEAPKTAWQRMGDGFVSSLKALGTGLTEFVIFLVTILPFLIPMAVLGGGILLVLHLKKRKAGKEREKWAEKKPE